MNFNRMATAVAAMTLLAAGESSAHHSGAMFDRAKEVTLTGVVKDWQWTNPHTWLQLVVQNEKGEPTEWSIEGQSPQVHRGRGWTRTVFKPGDKVTVKVHPLRDGALGGSIMSVTAADGNTYN